MRCLDCGQRDYKIETLGAYLDTFDVGQAVMRDSSIGINFGASDPRKNGEAIPEPLPAPEPRKKS
jgi:gamma-glutamyltranspeptidase/glutathione hydrolase